MKLLRLQITFLLFNIFSYSQTNLVPNPSFELYSNCPTTLGQINYANNWSSYYGSPDYYNTCNSNFLGVPSNGLGFQNAYSGSAYIGLIAFDISGFAREVIGAQLIQSLNVGQKYFVSFKASLSEFNGPPPQFIPCNKVGARFSNSPYQGSDSPYPGINPTSINNQSHIYYSSIISDTMNWAFVSGSFVADSNYNYIMIGNFFDDLQTDTISLINGVRSYFYIDEVCVSTDSILCNNVTNTNTKRDQNEISYYPNPCTGILNIKTNSNENYIIKIMDSSGISFFCSKFNKTLVINTVNIPTGVYNLFFQSSKEIINYKLVLIN